MVHVVVSGVRRVVVRFANRRHGVVRADGGGGERLLCEHRHYDGFGGILEGRELVCDRRRWCGYRTLAQRSARVSRRLR